MESLHRRKERRGGGGATLGRDEGPRSPNEVFRFDTRVR